MLFFKSPIEGVLSLRERERERERERRHGLGTFRSILRSARPGILFPGEGRAPVFFY